MSHDAAPVEEQAIRDHDWALVTLLHRVGLRFKNGWERTTASDRRTWGLRLTGGFVLTALVTAGLVWGARTLEQNGALGWDAAFLRWLRDSSPVSFELAMWMEVPGNSIMVLPLTLFAAGMAAWYYRPLRALTIFAGYFLAKVFVFQAWTMWDRQRPSLIRDGLAAPGGYFDAYPSGHTVQALFIYGFLTVLWMQRSDSVIERGLALVLLLVVMAATGIGRLRVGAHWPSDVLAGLVIGGVFLAGLFYALHGTEHKGKIDE